MTDEIKELRELIKELSEPMDTDIRKFEEHYDEQRAAAAVLIAELKTEIARLVDCKIRLHTALDVIEGAIHDAKLG
ncbi:MAG: hypothetical protein MJH10_15340 [Epibacterium sp.]|nr:hypothetical protein [Epibacterium sp.]NQX74893.1 hypothetical protein [Epibacterium sp.]